MKLKATITATIKVKENEAPSEANERVIEKLAETCAEWLDGVMAPYIKLEYTIKEEMEKINHKKNDTLLN